MVLRKLSKGKELAITLFFSSVRSKRYSYSSALISYSTSILMKQAVRGIKNYKAIVLSSLT